MNKRRHFISVGRWRKDYYYFSIGKLILIWITNVEHDMPSDRFFQLWNKHKNPKAFIFGDYGIGIGWWPWNVIIK